MDNEYLRHLDGSSYIDEGLGDRLKSWGSALAKKFSGEPVSPPAPDNSKTALARIIKRSLEILMDVVKSDVSHVPDWIDDPSKAPTQWGQVAEQEEDDDYDNVDDEEDDEEEKPRKSKLTKSKEFVEFEGEFLYNFAGKYKKFRSFTIELKPIHVSKTVVLTDLGFSYDKDLTVYWVNDRHFNTIFVSMKSSGGTSAADSSTSDTELLAFWDDWVNPKNKVSETLSLKLMMDTANPPSPGSDTNQLEGADPALVAEITEMCNGPLSKVGLTLNAVVLRKSMEFKAKNKGDISLKTINDGSGDVWAFDRTGKATRITKKAIVRSLGKKNRESEILRRSLIHADYFRKNPDVPEPPPITATATPPVVTTPVEPNAKELSKQYHHFDDVVLAVIELSKKKGKAISRKTAEPIVLAAWKSLVASGSTPDTITGEMLMRTILKGRQKTEEVINPFQGPNFLQY